MLTAGYCSFDTGGEVIQTSSWYRSRTSTTTVALSCGILYCSGLDKSQQSKDGGATCSTVGALQRATKGFSREAVPMNSVVCVSVLVAALHALTVTANCGLNEAS